MTTRRWKLVPTEDEQGLTYEEIYGISVRLRQELNSGLSTPIVQAAWNKLQATVREIEAEDAASG